MKRFLFWAAVGFLLASMVSQKKSSRAPETLSRGVISHDEPGAEEALRFSTDSDADLGMRMALEAESQGGENLLSMRSATECVQ